ncbi:hypothetical protein U1707_18460 [Sphingomonas sp. PB2P12]|uniref:hypothetical protein n=1 Tax=Sphingomonas sandaracina TaxID=3096157 RepID=UPI002FC5FE70
MPIKTYLDLDLATTGLLATDLFARAERESEGRGISLTGDGQSGAMSANLTPEMNAWLSTHVARFRANALNHVLGAAKRVRLQGGAEGFVEDFERDLISRDRAVRKAQETATFYEKQRGRLDRLDVAETEYLRLRTELGGRDAQVPSKLLVYGIPAVIMIPEFFMNYSSFFKLSNVPAIAAGLSLVVALAVAVSSYMTGMFLKAYQFYMRPDDEEQRSKGIRLMAIAMALLLISMTAVGYARYSTVLSQIEAALVLGMTPPNVIAQTAGLLAGNLIVFAVGAAFTYLQHDENPDYAHKAEKYLRLKAEMEALYAKQLGAKLADIDRNHKRRTEELSRRSNQMRSQPDNVEILHDAGQISSKDAEVVGLLRAYQNHLVDRICNRDPDFRFTGPAGERHAGAMVETITPNDFAARSIHLYRSVQL